MACVLDDWYSVGLYGAYVGLAAYLTFPPRRFVHARRTNFAKRSGAYVDPSFGEVIDRDTRLVTRLGALFLVMAVVVMTVSLHVDNGVPPTANVWALSSPLFAAWTAAVALVRLRAAGREFAVLESRGSVARPRRVSLSDYVSPMLQVSMWVAAAGVVAMAAAVVAAWRGGDAHGVAAIVAGGDAVCTLGTAVFTLWFGRSLSERPTPAVDASHLYLQDAWRASAVGWTFGLVIVSAFYSFLGLSSAAHLRWLNSALPLLIYPLIAAYVVTVLVQQTWFRRRLWRSLPHGHVLLPGQAVPQAGANA